ncbi:hypothetical protein Tco_0033572 [Tanacetum coccineum]
MMTLKFADTHNMVAFLAKPAESEGFEHIVDFLYAHTIKYALTINPTIYTLCIEQFWATIKAKTVNGEVQLQALVDGKKIIITESIVRRDLQLEDVEGVDCLPNATIFEQLTLMGSKTTAWNKFSSTMASAIIGLATNQKFNFSKYIFESMVKNLDDVSGIFLMYPRSRRSKRKETEVPQPSGPTTNVADKAVNEKIDDSLERVATTATGLEAKQDNGTSSGSGPWCQKTMGDTIAQTRSENVSKHSNDPLLARVLALETTKTTQATEIASLKRRVKKLERRNKSRTHGLKRLYKVGSSRRVESSDEEDMFGVNDLDGDEVIVESVDVVNTAEETRSVVEEVTIVTIPASAATTTTTTTRITDVEITLAQALVELKSAKPKANKDKGKGKMVESEPVKKISKKELLRLDEELTFNLQAEEEEEEERIATQEKDEITDEEKARLFVQFLEQRRKYFAAKKAEEKRNRPPTKAQQRSIICTYLKNMEGWKPKSLKNKSFVNIQELFDKAMKRVNTFVDYRTELVEESSKKAEAEIAHESSLERAREELEQESSKKQKLEEDKESEELNQCLEIIPYDGDDVTIEATPLSTKSPTIVDYKIYKEGKKSYFQIIRADVKARFKKTKPVKYMDNFLLLNLKTMFEHHVEDNVWKNQQGLVKVINWKLYHSCGVHCVTMQNMLFYLLVEKMYPLTNHTLHQMFNDVKLQVDYECEMAFELLRLGRIIGIKSLLEVTAAKLMLLVYKLLLLVLEVNAASTKVTIAQRLRLLKEFLLSRDG